MAGGKRERATMRLLRNQAQRDGVLVVTFHQANIIDLTGIAPASGEGIVVRYNQRGDDLEVLGRIPAPSTMPTATGGTPLGPGTATAVVVAQVTDGDYTLDQVACTGVLLEPRIVATAAHCILDRNTDRPKDLLDYYVVGPGSDFAQDHYQWSVLLDEVLLGTYRVANSQTDDWRANYAGDVALIVLAEPLPIREPVRIASSDEIDALVRSRAPMVSIGYGTGRTPDVLLQPLAVPREVTPAGEGDREADLARREARAYSGDQP